MDDAIEMTLRRRFAQAARPLAEEDFVDRLRVHRRRHARRRAVLRVLAVGAMLLASALAIRLLLPWLSQALHEAVALLERALQAPLSPAMLALTLALSGASTLAAWAWRQVLPGD